MPPAPWLRTAAPWFAVSVVLVAASVLTRYLAYVAQRRDPGSPPLAVLELFDVNSERNVPTLWSVLVLLVAAVLCGQLAGRARRGDGVRRGWLVLGALVVALALDEGLALHERLGDAGRALSGDALQFAWVVPGLLIGAVLAGLALLALRTHTRVLRRRLVLAGVVYVAGAVVLETLSGLALRADGDRELYVAVTALEELAEMAGLCLLVGALLLARRGAQAPSERTLTGDHAEDRSPERPLIVVPVSRRADRSMPRT